MNALKELLDQLKADTRDRGTMALLLFAACALVIAVAWVAIGSSGGSVKPPTAAVAPTPPVTPPSQPVANSPSHHNKARAKARARHLGSPRDPFEALYVPTKTEGGSGTGSKESAAASKNVPAPTSKEEGSGGKSTPPPTRKKVTHVTATTKVSAEAEGQPVPLEIVNHKVLKAKKPADTQMLAELIGLNAQRRTVTLKLGKNVHLVGGAVCVPSKTRCEAIKVKKNVVVHLEWRRPGESTVDIKLEVTGFTTTTTAAGARRHAPRMTWRAGLRRSSK